MWTLVEALEVVKAFGPFGAIVFGFYSINKTLKGNYINAINVENNKMRNEKNFVASSLIAELEAVLNRCYKISDNNHKVGDLILLNNFYKYPIIFEKLVPKLGYLSISSIQKTCNAYEVILAIPDIALLTGTVTKVDKELGDYRLANPRDFSQAIMVCASRIEAAIQSLKDEIT